MVAEALGQKWLVWTQRVTPTPGSPQAHSRQAGLSEAGLGVERDAFGSQTRPEGAGLVPTPLKRSTNLVANLPLRVLVPGPAIGTTPDPGEQPPRRGDHHDGHDADD